jgi:hypothetical protein
MTAAFRAKNVFIDVDGIAPGADFVTSNIFPVTATLSETCRE